jgi:signal transduction histidine kinase
MTGDRNAAPGRSPRSASIARRLALAFGSVAVMTVLASGVAIWAFGTVDRTFVVVADRGFPQATAALRLKSDSQEIALATMALTLASDDQTRGQLRARINLVIVNLRERIAILLKGHEVIDPLIASMPDRLEASVAQTDTLVRQRLSIEGQARELLAQAAIAQRDFLGALEPVETAANADLLAAARRTSLQAAASIHGLMDMEIASLSLLMKLRADAFRLGSKVVEAQFPGRQGTDESLRRQGAALFEEIKGSVSQIRVAEAVPVAQALVAALGPVFPNEGLRPPAGTGTPRGSVENEDRLRTVEAALNAFDRSLEPITRKLTFQMIAQSDSITGNAANAVVLLVAEEVASLSAILRVRGEGSLLASLIAQSPTTGPDRLADLQREFDATLGRLQEALLRVKASSDLKGTRTAVRRLAALGAGGDGIFAIRANQLQLQAIIDAAVARNQEAGSRFASLVSDLSDEVGRQLARQIGGVRLELDWNTILLASIALLSLLFSALVGWLYIGKGIAARLTRLADSMSQIAEGNFAAPIPSGRRDEIASMAEALRYFRDRIAAQRDLERAAVNAAERGNRVKSEFLANMSHELRTPLNAVIGFSSMLQARVFGELNAKQSEYVDDIHSSGQHLLSLINDILDLSKIEAGSMELQLTTFNVAAAIDSTITLIRERAARHTISVEHADGPGLPDITADERRFKQILLNLLSNAVKFTPDGGGVSVGARAADGAVEVSVSDTGIGIAPEDLEAVFDKFRQVGRSSLGKAEGTGLGLALTREFVELHGGKITVTSELGKGSTFTFTVPFIQAVGHGVSSDDPVARPEVDTQSFR